MQGLFVIMCMFVELFLNCLCDSLHTLTTIHLKLVGSILTMMLTLIDNSRVLPGDVQLFIIILIVV